MGTDWNERGTMNVNYNCYSMLSHAKNKSLEELRIEDYKSDRKVIFGT